MKNLIKLAKELTDECRQQKQSMAMSMCGGYRVMIGDTHTILAELGTIIRGCLKGMDRATVREFLQNIESFSDDFDLKSL